MKMSEIAALQSIADTLESQPFASQRTLAKNAHISPGLMNAVLKRFAERGWIMLSNVNKRKLAYALTDEGIKELTARTRKFARRTFELAGKYNEILSSAVLSAKESGKTKVVLCGESCIKFLLEYACKKNSIEFEKKDILDDFSSAIADLDFENAFCIAGELNNDETKEKLVNSGCVDLLDLVENSCSGF